MLTETLAKIAKTDFQTIAVGCGFISVRKVAPEKNCPPAPPPPPVRVRVWFRISVRIRAGGNFPRTGFIISFNRFSEDSLGPTVC